MLANALRQLPGVDTAAVFVVEEVQHRLVAARTSAVHAQLLEGLSMAIGERMSGWAAATCQPMINADAALDLFDVPASGLRAAIAVPCSGPSDVQIVLTLYSTSPDAFSSLHHGLLSSAGSFLQSLVRQRHVRAERFHGSRSQVPWRHGSGRSRGMDDWNGHRQPASSRTFSEVVRARRQVKVI